MPKATVSPLKSRLASSGLYSCSATQDGLEPGFSFTSICFFGLLKWHAATRAIGHVMWRKRHFIFFFSFKIFKMLSGIRVSNSKFRLVVLCTINLESTLALPLIILGPEWLHSTNRARAFHFLFKLLYRSIFFLFSPLLAFSPMGDRP